MDADQLLDRRRRKHGLILGLVTGLVFGLFSQGINYAVLAGIEFYQPPLGALGNLLLWVLIGGGLGLVTAWSGSGIEGVILGSLAAGLLIVVSVLLTSNLSRSLSLRLIGLSAVYLPFAAGTLPLLALLRVAVNHQRDWYELHPLAWKRARLPLVLLLLAGAFGALWLYPPEGRQELADMDRLIRTGLQGGALPAALQDELVGAFAQKATSRYSLELVTQDLNRYQIPYSLRGLWVPQVVLARFSNGWALACLFVSPKESPFCRGIDNLEHFLTFGDDQTDTFTDHGFYVPNR